ncbi:Cation_acetate symporter ActP [Streptomyces sp. enrichment culture]
MNDFSSGTQATVLLLFTVLVTLTLLMCVMAGPDRDDLANFYTGYRSLTPFKNGLAIAGDYISAATVLSTTGIVALTGYDGYVLAVSTALSLVLLMFLLLMFLLAEPLRNAGRFTMGDVLARNMPGRAVRVAACVVTLSATVPFLVVQLSGAGSLLTFILDLPHLAGARTGSIVIVGSLMIIYAALGGMRGTALVQMVKIVFLLATSLAVAALVLNRFDWSPSAVLRAAQQGSGAGPAFLQQGLQLGTSAGERLDFIGFQITVVLGVLPAPHHHASVLGAGRARRTSLHVLGGRHGHHVLPARDRHGDGCGSAGGVAVHHRGRPGRQDVDAHAVADARRSTRLHGHDDSLLGRGGHGVHHPAVLGRGNDPGRGLVARP